MKKIIASFFLLLASQLTNAQVVYPPNIFADTAHAPFTVGVASGDPTSEGVLIWTRIEPSTSSDTLALNWELSADQFFSQVIQSGSATTDSSKDWTATIDVTGLQAGMTYYYRFFDNSNNYSVVGRTKTAPSGSVDRLKFGIASCSSIFSGYFNAYARMSERNDLDLIIHVGDYIYDFVDPDEEVRVTDPWPVDPSNLEEYRDRHYYYLLDPDLRAARQMHPWSVMWDNHDVSNGGNPEAIQAFLEYVPTRVPDISRSDRIYRTLNYGDLVDVIMMDVLLFRNIDTLSNGENTIMDNEQFEWLEGKLDNSMAKWRILGTQKLAGKWEIPLLPIGPVTANSWDGFPGSRVRLLSFLEQNNIDNNVFVSGDSHVSIGCDLPYNPDSAYDGETGQGSIAVEMLPTSISRGNIDEMGVDPNLIPTVVQISMQVNPHHVFEDLTQHGYGILNVKPDSVIAEYWYSEILDIETTQTFGGGLVVKDGDNYWQREILTSPPDDTDTINSLVFHKPISFKASQVFPNPGNEIFNIRLVSPDARKVHGQIIQLPSYQLVREFNWNIDAGERQFPFELPEAAKGTYALILQSDDLNISRLFIKQ